MADDPYGDTETLALRTWEAPIAGSVTALGVASIVRPDTRNGAAEPAEGPRAEPAAASRL